MPTPPLSKEALAKTAAALDAAGGNLTHAAATLGITRSTMQHRLKLLRSHGAALEVAEAPPVDEPIEDLIARKKAAMKRARDHEAWAKLIPVTVPDHKPIGLLLVGDPHVDDDHCDIDRLEHDLTTVGRTEGFYAGHLGDLTNNWVGRLQRLYANQSTSFRDGLRLTEWMLGLCPNLFVIGGNHDCHDIETEALTHRGWLKADQIEDTDLVLTMNTATGRAEWNPILARVDKSYDGEMVRIESNAISALVTPGHRILHRRRDRIDGAYHFRPELEYVEAQNLPSRFAVPTCAKQGAEGCGLTDEQIALAGWILTDGSIERDGGYVRVSLWQSKDASEIRRLLAACELEYVERVRERDVTAVAGRVLVKPPLPQRVFVLSAQSSRRVVEWVPDKGVLPPWVEDTSERQFDVFLDALVQGDGTWDGADPAEKRVAVLHGEKDFLDQVQQIAIRRGWTARISVARGKDYRLNLCRRQELQLERGLVSERVHYVGRVWCLTVPNGNFMVRRNGAAHFSGNCWNAGMDLLRFIVRQGGPLQPHGARLALRWPDGKEIRIHARHDFTGKSQFSDTHGMKRELLFGHRDHILVAGHTHVDEARVEPSVDGDVHWLFRVSGYKVVDDFAKERGFRPKRLAPSVSLIINPAAPVPAEQVKPFWDTEAAADYLTWLRKRK